MNPIIHGLAVAVALLVGIAILFFVLIINTLHKWGVFTYIKYGLQSIAYEVLLYSYVSYHYRRGTVGRHTPRLIKNLASAWRNLDKQEKVVERNRRAAGIR